MREVLRLTAKKTYITNNNRKIHLVTYSQADSIISDQFRTIRTNIKFLTKEDEKNVMLVTSTGDGEGKSTTIANLAVSIAQQKEKVLVIDANLREPVIHEIFKVSNDIGLTSILKGMTTANEAISTTDVEYLDVLASGLTVSSPTELLGSKNMTELLRTVSENYDMVLIDAPALLTSTETSVLSNRCTGVVLVVNRGKTSMENTITAKRVLELAHAKLMGVIFNK